MVEEKRSLEQLRSIVKIDVIAVPRASSTSQNDWMLDLERFIHSFYTKIS